MQDKKTFFEKCFNDNFERVVSYLYVYCKDRELAKNITQDAFVKLWENMDKIDMSRTALPYLISVSRNLLINHYTRSSVKDKYSSYIMGRNRSLSLEALELQTTGVVYYDDLGDALRKSMNHMTPKVREAFEMSRLKGMKNAAIAEKLGISVKAVEFRLMSAMRIIRKDLSDFVVPLIILSIFDSIS